MNLRPTLPLFGYIELLYIEFSPGTLAFNVYCKPSRENPVGTSGDNQLEERTLHAKTPLSILHSSTLLREEEKVYSLLAHLP